MQKEKSRWRKIQVSYGICSTSMWEAEAAVDGDRQGQMGTNIGISARSASRLLPPSSISPQGPLLLFMENSTFTFIS